MEKSRQLNPTTLWEVTNVEQYIPLDGKSSHTGLLSKNVATDLLDDGLGGGIGVELLRLIFVVDVVSHSHELTAVIGAGQEHDRHAHDLRVGDALGVRRVRLENELVNAHRDGSHQQSV